MMKKSYHLLVLGFFWLNACGSPTAPSATGLPVEITEQASSRETPTLPAELNSSGLSANQVASLESLRLLDGYPLYSMYLYGNYSLAENALPDTHTDFFSQKETGTWACSLFTAIADPGSRLFGRNFDWDYSPALLLFTDPPNGYASVSMVDIAYLGYEGNRGSQLLDLPLSERVGLLDAPFLPFDGMNETGLAVGMAAVPESPQPETPSRQTIDSLLVIRFVLENAQSIDEALDIFRQYRLDWGRGPALHYLVADQTGRSVLIEFWEGEMVVIENNKDWQAATNFLQSVYAEDLDGVCNRYDSITDQMEAADGRLSAEGAVALLAAVSQSNTQWSVVYSQGDGAVRVVMGRNYDQVHIEWLEMVNEAQPNP